MRDILDIDGPVRNTYATVKRALDMNPTNEAGSSNPRRGYKIQLPSDSTEGRTIQVDDIDSDQQGLKLYAPTSRNCKF